MSGTGTPAGQPALPLVIYDGDCGFCDNAARWAASHISFDLIAFQRLGDARLAQLGLSTDLVQQSVWVFPEQTTNAGRLSGAAACAYLLRRSSRRPWRLLGAALQLPGARCLAEVGYRLVAANRHRLPGSTGSCRIE